VARPVGAEVLGFSFSNNKEPKRRHCAKGPVALQAENSGTWTDRRTQGSVWNKCLKELTAYLRGWKSYFGTVQTPSLLKTLEPMIRHRLRFHDLKQWKRGTARYAKLRQLGIDKDLAAQNGGPVLTARGVWRTALLCNAPYPCLLDSPSSSSTFRLALRDPLNRPMRTRRFGCVAGESGATRPLCPIVPEEFPGSCEGESPLPILMEEKG